VSPAAEAAAKGSAAKALAAQTRQRTEAINTAAKAADAARRARQR